MVEVHDFPQCFSPHQEKNRHDLLYEMLHFYFYFARLVLTEITLYERTFLFLFFTSVVDQ